MNKRGAIWSLLIVALFALAFMTFLSFNESSGAVVGDIADPTISQPIVEGNEGYDAQSRQQQMCAIYEEMMRQGTRSPKIPIMHAQYCQ